MKATAIRDHDTAQRLGQDSVLMEQETISQQIKQLLCIPGRSSPNRKNAEKKEREQRSYNLNAQTAYCAEGDVFPSHRNVGNDDSESSNSSSSVRHNKECPDFIPPSDEVAVKIMEEAESLFSDFNVIKDSFLQKHIRRSKDGYISVKFIASFRKIRALTRDWREVEYSLRDSEKLMLNELGTKVRRVDPIPDFEDTSYAKTVVIFNLPDDQADSENVCTLMTPYGEIVCAIIVNPDSEIPEYCTKRFLTFFKDYVKHKRFAVVEFRHYESAVTVVSESEKNNESQLKIVPLISDEYRNQSKPSSRRRDSPRKGKSANNDREDVPPGSSPGVKSKSFPRRKKYFKRTDEIEAEASDSSDNLHNTDKKSRKRVEDAEFVPPSKELEAKILKQAEDWFSDFSVFKTSFLLNHIRRSKEGYISVKLVASSRRLRALTKDWRVVQYSLRNSEKLALNERGGKVRRVDPVTNFEDTVFAKTVVVFNLPIENVDAENLSRLMSPQGTVINVTIVGPETEIPDICTKRFLTIHTEFVKDKFFAIVEYQDYESAVKAVTEHYNPTNDERYLKVVPLMSDAYKSKSNPASTKRDSKSPKADRSSNSSRGSRRKSLSANKQKFRKMRANAENAPLSNSFVQSGDHLEKVKASDKPLNEHQEFEAKARRSSKTKISSRVSSISPPMGGARISGSSSRREGPKGTGPSMSHNSNVSETPNRYRSNRQNNQRSPPANMRGSRYASTYPDPFTHLNVDPYWDSNLSLALNNRMFPRNPCSEQPPYNGSSMNLPGNGNRWPLNHDSARGFRGRGQNEPFWMSQADMLSREYERWQSEFRTAYPFPMISSPM